MKLEKTIAIAANWDSNVGYAWWLMESFWVKISEEFFSTHKTIICYPTISILPENIAACSAEKIELNFIKSDFVSLIKQCLFIIRRKVKHLYFTDRSPARVEYLVYRLFGVKTIIIHDHTPGIRTVPKGFLKILKTIKSHIPFINADACFGATDFVKNRLINVNCLPRNKCISISNGIPIMRQHTTVFDLRAEYNIPKDSFIVLTASRAHQYKGIEFALRVIANVFYSKPNNNIYYFFIGDGPHLGNFKKLSHELGIQEKVIFAGKISNIHSVLPSANCAFHPSYGEVGYSLSILECMFFELALLVSDNPSVCGATQDGVTGFIYKEHDIDDASKKLIQLWSNPHLAIKMGRAAKQIVEKHYNIENTHNKLILELKRLFNR